MANILIIEDNAAQREALEEFLTATGDEHRVYLAPDGELARAVFKERALDLIISDLMLPDTTGIELVREFRQSSDIPFLIITGEPSIESAVEAIQLGANDYLTKPVD
ncbi:MAG: response regulator, partial [Leptospiraceae bacterium]|nr:response regulator [Leptospiraceae bacterium]